MKVLQTLVSFVVLGVVLIDIQGLLQKCTLTDLREFQFSGITSRFAVHRSIIMDLIESRKTLDKVCGNDVLLEYPKSLLHSPYDSLKFGEVLLTYYRIEDETLKRELTCEQKEEVATSYQILNIALPVSSRSEHAVIGLIDFTDSKTKVLSPFYSSSENISYIDRMDDENGTVTLRNGKDVMILQYQHDVHCQNDAVLMQDFDDIMGSVPVKGSNYPMPFDIGCETLESNVSFCRKLAKYQCDLQRVDGDVCVLSFLTRQNRCPASLKIVKVTGFFRDALPFFADLAPVVSFESEWTISTNVGGLQYPCFS